MRHFPSLAWIACSFALVGCSNVGDIKPDPTRQAWSDSWEALPSAKAADQDALSRSFRAAHDQVMMPYVNAGEDALGIARNLHGILNSIGDLQFSEALLRESPETRSAVRDCMFEIDVKPLFPKTHEVLLQAPNLKWPSDIAYEQSYASDGKKAPPKKAWTP